MFGRGRRRDGADMPRDREFPYLSEAEAARLRVLVRDSFAERGIEVTVEPGRVSAGEARQFGLANLAAVCHNDRRGSRSWPALVDTHVDRVVRALDGPRALEALPHEQLLARLRPRFIPGEPRLRKAFGYGPPSVPGLLEVLALDLPETVAMLTADDLAGLGDLTGLRERALRNLRAVRVDRHERVEDGSGARFDVLMGRSYFVASLALVLDEVVRRHSRDALTPDGILVVLPHRHQLAYHVILDGDVLPSLNLMARFAAAGHEESPGALSRSVFWWRDGESTEVATSDDAGAHVRLTEEGVALAARFSRR
jgi:hypothetical protein